MWPCSSASSMLERPPQTQSHHFQSMVRGLAVSGRSIDLVRDARIEHDTTDTRSPPPRRHADWLRLHASSPKTCTAHMATLRVDIGTAVKSRVISAKNRLSAAAAIAIQIDRSTMTGLAVSRVDMGGAKGPRSACRGGPSLARGRRPVGVPRRTPSGPVVHRRRRGAVGARTGPAPGRVGTTDSRTKPRCRGRERKVMRAAFLRR